MSDAMYHANRADQFESEAASQQERAEVAEGALGQLRGSLAALAFEWEQTYGPDAGYPHGKRVAASELRAVLFPAEVSR